MDRLDPFFVTAVVKGSSQCFTGDDWCDNVGDNDEDDDLDYHNDDEGDND